MNPVMLAACFLNIEIMKLLLDNGGGFNVCDKAGMAPKGYVQKLGQKKMVEFLTEKGAKFNVYSEE